MLEHFPRIPTKDRIIQAAEKLYITQGISATSLRHITQEAEVNLAAVNYYFGSKEGLTKAIFLHRYIPYVRSCAQALHNLPPLATIPDIVNALLRPLEELSALPGRRGFQVINLLIRIGNESPQSHQLIRAASEEMIHTLLCLLQESLPHFDEECLKRRIFVLFKAILYSFNGKDIFNIYADDRDSMLDMPSLIAELRVIVEAGLMSPPPEIQK
ncbi:MAG: TetR/AcrR family transcriptional regulator [Cardiobacteriaceae bacterium]|nr:TetR/AcrR family transcriptional regulator [Cardiobacteriaceae bacterium]